ncbi:MAG: FAD-dependent oxidoreductase [Porphyrobacter sp.]|nr:FAD-dependent oxidoreductase [Porphyrobacter sp.]
MDGYDLVLVGGGHANLAVLADWICHGIPAGARVALVTPDPFLTYSAMVPGWIAGQYRLAEGRVDLAALAGRAGVRLIAGRCVGIAPDARIITLENGDKVAFRLVAIDTGGAGRADQILGDGAALIDVRPMDRFVARLAQWHEANRAMARRIVVIGGGAGGVELAFACANMAGLAEGCAVVLVTGRDGLLPGFAPRLRGLAARELARQSITVIAGEARCDGGELYADGEALGRADLVLAALGSAAPEWPRSGGLACDPAGFIAVDRHQRSLSHPHVLAAGDIAARADRAVPHSGVHAVHTGPVLAANLRALLSGQAPRRSYTPRSANLYLLNCGNGTALASYGPLAAHGRWVARLKQRIDTRWIAAYAQIAGVPPDHGLAPMKEYV